MRERTMDLKKLETGHPFVWGQILYIHKIAEYAIAEYMPWIVEDGSTKVGIANLIEIRFHGWLDGTDMSQSWPTLDAALAGLITIKHAGHNSQAGYFFMKMLTA